MLLQHYDFSLFLYRGYHSTQGWKVWLLTLSVIVKQFYPSCFQLVNYARNYSARQLRLSRGEMLRPSPVSSPLQSRPLGQ